MNSFTFYRGRKSSQRLWNLSGDLKDEWQLDKKIMLVEVIEVVKLVAGMVVLEAGHEGHSRQRS